MSKSRNEKDGFVPSYDDPISDQMLARLQTYARGQAVYYEIDQPDEVTLRRDEEYPALIWVDAAEGVDVSPLIESLWWRLDKWIGGVPYEVKASLDPDPRFGLLSDGGVIPLKN